MKNNMANADRVIRLFAAAIIVVLYFTNVISGTPATILLVLSGVLVLTGIVGFCPLYRLFHISTVKKS